MAETTTTTTTTTTALVYPNRVFAVVVNDSVDAGEVITEGEYDFTHNTTGGNWMISGGPITLTFTPPALFYKSGMYNTGNPVGGDVVTMKSQINDIPPVTRDFNPSTNRFRYLISSTEYSSAQIATILSNSTAITSISLVTEEHRQLYEGSFTATLVGGSANYLYMIWDFRNNS